MIAVLGDSLHGDNCVTIQALNLTRSQLNLNIKVDHYKLL